MRFTINNPSDSTMRAVLGFDPTAVGYFVEVRQAGRLVDSYDGLRHDQTTIDGVLTPLVNHGFITEDAIAEAVTWLPHMDAADIEDPDVRRAAEVIERLRAASSKG